MTSDMRGTSKWKTVIIVIAAIAGIFLVTAALMFVGGEQNKSEFYDDNMRGIEVASVKSVSLQDENDNDDEVSNYIVGCVADDFDIWVVTIPGDVDAPDVGSTVTFTDTNVTNVRTHEQDSNGHGMYISGNVTANGWHHS